MATKTKASAKHYDAILAPVITEKSTLLSEDGKVVFHVPLSATKTEIKDAIEALFNVKVKSVRTLNVKGKTKNFGRTVGKRNDWKKAYVALESGHDIDFLAAE